MNRKHDIQMPPDAGDVEIDNSTIGCTDSEHVQGALEDLCSTIDTTASPGHTFGREGTHSSGTWLITAESVSNKRGSPFGLKDGYIRKVTVSTQDIPGIFTIEVYYHSGNLAGSTLIGSVTTSATASTEHFIVNWSVPQETQIAVKISATSSPKPNNTGVFLDCKGDLT